MLLFYPPPDLHARPANSACRIIIAFRLVRYTPYTSVATKVFPFPLSLSFSLSLFSALSTVRFIRESSAFARDPTRSASAFTDLIFSRDHAWNDDGVHLSGGHFSARRMAAGCTCNQESLVKTCGINFSARDPASRRCRRASSEQHRCKDRNNFRFARLAGDSYRNPHK